MGVISGITTEPVSVSIPSLSLKIHVPAGTPCRKLGERAFWTVSDIMSDANHYGIRIPDEKVTVH